MKTIGSCSFNLMTTFELDIFSCSECACLRDGTSNFQVHLFLQRITFNPTILWKHIATLDYVSYQHRAKLNTQPDAG